jgi:hypothetical protein
MNKTVYIDTAELDAITRRLDYVNGINAGPAGGLLTERDPAFKRAKEKLESLARGDQMFVMAA